jgi:hypothetical protein
MEDGRILIQRIVTGEKPHDAGFALMKQYLLVRWRKRWPIVPAVAIWAFFCSITVNEKKAHSCFVIAVLLVVVSILFPFRWGEEDWK